jgi:hypothetical protein
MDTIPTGIPPPKFWKYHMMMISSAFLPTTYIKSTIEILFSYNCLIMVAVINRQILIVATWLQYPAHTDTGRYNVWTKFTGKINEGDGFRVHLGEMMYLFLVQWILSE